MRAYKIAANEARTVETDASLKDMYDMIGCRCIDIVVRDIGGIAFNVVLDDEGLLVDTPIPSAIDAQVTPQLYGTLLVFGIGDDGDLRGLTHKEEVTLGRRTFDVLSPAMSAVLKCVMID